MTPTLEFRFVDVSTFRESYVKKVLQQKFVDKYGFEWRDVPFVGHIDDLED